MTAAYNSTMTDSKLNKKKQFADPSFGKFVNGFIQWGEGGGGSFPSNRFRSLRAKFLRGTCPIPVC